MFYHRILEVISKCIKDNDKKTDILHIIKELLKNKCNSCDVFFDIFKHIGNDIKNLYTSIGPHLFIAFSDNQCCSLIWKVDKYIDIDGNPVIVPSRCSRNRIDKTSLYCRTHNNPKSTEHCKLCSKDMEEYIYHEKNWEHFGNIFQFHLNSCFNAKNIDNCYQQNYTKSIDNIRCISYAEFFIERNRNKWIKYTTNSIQPKGAEITNVINVTNVNLKYETMNKQDRDIIIPKKKNKNISELCHTHFKIPITTITETNTIVCIELDDEQRAICWCAFLNYIFNNKPKVEKSISTITIFDKDDVSLYTNEKFIYNSNFKIEGIIINSDIAVFRDDTAKYINSLDISKIDDKLLKVFIKEVLQ